jgi:TRAP transporter 4TM/12TM fusion protein
LDYNDKTDKSTTSNCSEEVKPEDFSSTRDEQLNDTLDVIRKSSLVKENIEMEQELSLIEEDYTLFKDKNHIGKAAYIVALCMAIYHIYTTVFGVPAPMIHRPSHFGFALILMFLAYDRNGKRAAKEKLVVIDYIGMALALGMVAFYFINKEYLMRYMWYITPVTAKAIVITAVVIFLSLYSGKRMVGKIFIGVSITFIIYAWAGPYLPGLLKHRGIAFNKFCDTMALISEGIFGGAMGVSATYIYNFILFGSFLKASQAGKFFIDISLALAGKSRGGPAKVAIFSSAFVGTISGSVVANVLTTGSFTIPLMKKLGYKKEFAAAVEATASTGGMIMPPVMGATAFLVAELAGVPYGKLCIYAIFPAVLYYLGLLFMIDLEAAKTVLKGMKKEDIPNAGEVFKKGWYKLIPLVVLIVMVFMGYSPLKCGLYAIVITIVVSWFDPERENRMGPKKIIDALAEGSINCVQVAAACACAGIVVGITSQTGLGFRMADAFMKLSGGYLLPSLFFCAIIGLILGMGLTITPSANSFMPPNESHLFPQPFT